MIININVHVNVTIEIGVDVHICINIIIDIFIAIAIVWKKNTNTRKKQLSMVHCLFEHIRMLRTSMFTLMNIMNMTQTCINQMITVFA